MAVAIRKARTSSTSASVRKRLKLAMPLWARRLFFKDLHHMFLYYEVEKGPKGKPEDFKKVVPGAMSAEDWFRFHGRYANGERICE